jgi:hypothetical protein
VVSRPSHVDALAHHFPQSKRLKVMAYHFMTFRYLMALS